MKAFRLGAFVAIVSSLTAIPAASGSVQDKPQSVVGVVVQTDGSRNALAIRTDTGEVVFGADGCEHKCSSFSGLGQFTFGASSAQSNRSVSLRLQFQF